jgi:replicative DNA helicase Mcm
MFGGVKKTREDGVKSRGDIHILLIGEPGTGKSQMLKFSGQIAPKGRYVVGKSSTGAGLCVTEDTLIHTEEGFREIGEIGKENISFSPEVETAKQHKLKLPTFSDGEISKSNSSLVWRMPEKDCVKAETVYGKEIEASKNTDILTCGVNGLEWKKIDDIEEGDFIASPDYTEITRESPDIEEYYSFENEKFKLGQKSSEELRDKMEDEYGDLRTAAEELDLSEDFVYSGIRKRFIPYHRLKYLLKEFNTEFDQLEIDSIMLQNGEEFTLPEEFDRDLMYLIGMVFGDGNISIEENRGLVRVSNSDRDLLEKCQDIIEEKFSKQIEIEEQEDRVPYLRIHSKTIAEFFQNLGMQTPKEGLKLDSKLTTSRNVDKFLQGLLDADGSVVSRDNGSDSIQYSTISHKLADQVQLMLETYGIKSKKRTRDRRGIEKLENGQEIESKLVQKHLVIRGEHIDRFKEEIGFKSVKKHSSLKEITGKKRNTNQDIVPINNILKKSEASPGNHWTYFNQDKNPGGKKVEQILEEIKLEEQIEEKLKKVQEAEINWEKVKNVEETGEKELYDLTVPETHNFIGNGIITHNTAAVVRDETTGEFELEAGAVVLANKGLAAIDEIDKMSEEDRSSLHEAMEQQQISISKANIQATLHAQTSILAAGNPKLGRFDPYEPIPQQIEIGDTLLSRFDFIFPVKDEPDEDKDTKLSSQVLQNHIDPEETDAEIPQEMLRKYVAYAKKNVRPQLTQDAADKIQEFYVSMRTKGSDEAGESVPITARQLEALVRVAEASARSELKDEVTVEDAKRAIDILTYCLKQVGVDPETGEFDIDVVESGVTSSQRNRQQTIKHILNRMAGDSSCEMEDVLEEAEEEGLDRGKAEKMIKQLMRDGEVFEPEPGKVKMM